MERLEDIHRFASLLKKYCEAYNKTDNLYEVSAVAIKIEEMLNKLSYEIYCEIHRNDKSITEKELLRQIKKAI